MVVMTDPEGKVSSNQLASFRTQECLAILNGSYPELQRMVANKRRAGEVRPALSLTVAFGGPHFIVDMRSYRLNVSNSGGDCKGLRVSSQLPGGWTKASHPCDISRGQKAEVDLGVSKEVGGSERLELRIDCEDVDGRELLRGGVGATRRSLARSDAQTEELGRSMRRFSVRLSRALAQPPS